MSDPTTWIDVVDNAVKVGLGALVGGGFTYLVSKLDHEKEASREFAKRRMDGLEKASNEIERFSRALTMYWANLANGLHKKKAGTLTTDDQKSLDEQERKLFDCFPVLARAKYTLALLGENKCVAAINSFAEKSNEFFQIANIGNEESCTIENLEAHKLRIGPTRDSVFAELSSAYTKYA